MCFVSLGNECLKKWSWAIFYVQSNVLCVHSCSGLAGSTLIPFPIFSPSEGLICIYETCEKRKKNRHNETRKAGLKALVGAHLEFVAFWR